MKRFFSLNLQGRDFVWPVLGVWLLVAVVTVAAGTLMYNAAVSVDTMTVVNGRWFVELLLWGLVEVAVLFGGAMCSLLVVKRTLVATEFDGAPFECAYDTRRYVGIALGGAVLSVITFGLYLPWYLVRQMRFWAEGVSHKFHLVSFRGKPMRLFAISILAAVAPTVVTTIVAATLSGGAMTGTLDMMSFAPLLALGIVVVELFFVSLYVVLTYAWMTNLTYGDKVLTSRLSALPATGFVMGQIVLTLLTCGLYAPMAELRIMRYVAERSVVVSPEGEEKSLGLRLRSWRDWAWLWGQVLLLTITLGLYLPWYYAKVMNRFGGRLYVEDK